MDDAHVAEFALEDVALWRGGKAPVSACLLAATLCSWLLTTLSPSHNPVSLASDALLLLLAILFLWAKSARLLNRPPPPVPDLRPAADRLASCLRSALAAAAEAFNRIAAGSSPSSSSLLARAFLALSFVSFLAGSPAFRYPAVVAALTLPPLYVRWDVDAYLRLASANLYRYELLYQRLCLACFRTARDWIMLDDDQDQEQDDHRLLLLKKSTMMS